MTAHQMARAVSTAVVLAAFSTLPAFSQDIREERVQFADGESATTIEGRIQGYEVVDYVLRASAGQHITIAFESSNSSGYFNLLPGDSPTGIHTGSVEGDRYDGMLPDDGDYRIRVYLMRNAARRDEVTDYSIQIATEGEAAGAVPAADYADALAGGPDFWSVANVPAGDVLNVRSGPGTGNEIVGALGNGDRARNLGCRMVGESRWCQIEAGTEMKFTGWVNGHYLVEAGGPQDGGIDSEVTGEVPCTTAEGQPTRSCPFRATRGPNGNTSVWVTLPAGGERYIQFRSGEPITAEAGLDVTFERSGDLYLIRIGVERYEIPEAVVFGG